jgi:hypothetical protein
MVQIDDVSQSWSKQIVLTVVPWSAHWRSPKARISFSEGITKAPESGIQNARKPTRLPAFLQNRLLAQVKSSRLINRFGILHGRQYIYSLYAAADRDDADRRSSRLIRAASASSMSLT